MRMLIVLIRYKLYELHNHYRHPLQVLLCLPRLIFDASVFYFLSVWLFRNPDYALIILTAGLLLTFSLGLYTGFYGLFAKKESLFLLATPVAFPSFLAYNYLERLPRFLEFALLLGLPAALVIGSINGYLPVLLLFAVIIFALSLLSDLLVIITGCLFGSMSQLVLVMVPLVALLLPVLMASTLKGISFTGQLWSGTYIIMAAILILLILPVSVGSPWLGRLYNTGLEKMQNDKNHSPWFVVWVGYWLLGVLKGPTWAIIVKDYLLHARNPVQWVRAFLLLVTVACYSLLKMQLVPVFLGFPYLDVVVVLALTHFIVNELVVNAFAAEANCIKLLFTAPVGAFKIVFAKYISYGLPVLSMGVLCIGVLDFGLGVDASGLLLPITIGGAILFGVTTVLVGLGALGCLPDHQPSGFIDQFLIEQTAISSAGTLLVFGISTAVLVANVAIVVGISRIFSTSTMVLVIVCTNLLIGLISLCFGAWRINRMLIR